MRWFAQHRQELIKRLSYAGTIPSRRGFTLDSVSASHARYDRLCHLQKLKLGASTSWSLTSIVFFVFLFSRPDIYQLAIGIAGICIAAWGVDGMRHGMAKLGILYIIGGVIMMWFTTIDDHTQETNDRGELLPSVDN